MQFIDSTQDPWLSVAAEADLALTSDWSLLSLTQWQTVRTTWPAAQRVGVALQNHEDPALLRDDVARLALVALDFPKWTDGRAYSQARLLRSRLRFRAEIRATGEVLVDMLPLLQRSGFNALVLKAGQSLDAAQRALRFIPAHYQTDAIGGLPIFSRGHLTNTALPRS
jgi:uncharacterized protein (DUF934 family)